MRDCQGSLVNSHLNIRPTRGNALPQPYQLLRFKCIAMAACGEDYIRSTTNILDGDEILSILERFRFDFHYLSLTWYTHLIG
jgi:hypothetical protein